MLLAASSNQQVDIDNGEGVVISRARILCLVYHLCDSGEVDMLAAIEAATRAGFVARKKDKPPLATSIGTHW